MGSQCTGGPARPPSAMQLCQAFERIAQDDPPVRRQQFLAQQQQQQQQIQQQSQQQQEEIDSNTAAMAPSLDSSRSSIWQFVAREEVQALGDIVQSWSRGATDGQTARRQVQLRVLRDQYPLPTGFLSPFGYSNSLSGSLGGGAAAAELLLLGQAPTGSPSSSGSHGQANAAAEGAGSSTRQQQHQQEEASNSTGTSGGGGNGGPSGLLQSLDSSFLAGLAAAAAFAGGRPGSGGASDPFGRRGVGQPPHEVFAVMDSIFGSRFYEDARVHAMREMGLDGTCPVPDEVRASFREKAAAILEVGSQQTERAAGTTARLDLVRLCLCTEVLRHVRGPARGATATPRPVLASTNNYSGPPQWRPASRGATGGRSDIEGPPNMDLIFVMGGPRSGSSGGMMLIGLSGTGALPGGAGGPGGGPPFRFDRRFLQERVGALLEALLVADGRLGQAAGLSLEDMDRHCPVGPRVASENDDEDGCCPVCLEPSVAGEEVRKLPCGHMLHKECCEAWLSNADTCPMCRYQVPHTTSLPRC